MPRPQLLLLGDSITQLGSDPSLDGWVCLLLDRYNRSADIVQRGLAGYTTQWFMDVVMATLTQDLGTSLHPALITLWLGANDAALPDGPLGEQHVPLPVYKRNLHAMVAAFKARTPQAEVLLITPPAIDDARRLQTPGGQDHTNAVTRGYAHACVEVAHEAGVEVLDLYTILNALPEPQWKALLVDGLHFTSAGNRFMEQQLADHIKAKFPTLQQQLERIEFPLFELKLTVAPTVATPAPGLVVESHVGNETDATLALQAGPLDARRSVIHTNAEFATVVACCVVLVGVVVVAVARKLRTRGTRRSPRHAERARLLV